MHDHLPSGTVTSLYSNIEGCVALWKREPKQMQAALEKHPAVLQESSAASGGHAYKVVGNAFQAAFEFSSQAVQAAVLVQLALTAEDSPNGSVWG